MGDGGPNVSLRSVGRSALILTGGTAVVQVVGIGRELFVAAQVGLSRDLDALLIALILPLTLSGVLTSGTITALVPAYLEARAAGGLPQARRLAGTVLTWVAIGGLLLAVALATFAGAAVGFTGPGLDGASRASAAAYLQLLAPVAFFAAVAGILTSICQAEERFLAIAVASLAGPALGLAVLLALWPPLELGAYALGSLLAPMATVAILLVATARASLTPIPRIRTSGEGIGAFLRHAAPLTLSAAILQLNVVADRAIASLLAPGAVSALRYGEVLIRTPIAAIAPAWGSAMYPAQARAAVAESAAELVAATSRSLAYAIAALVPVAALTAAVAPLAVEVAFGRGAFGAADVAVTSRVVVAFAPLMVILMVSPILAGALNARRRGLVLLATGAMNVVMNLILDVTLGIWLGVAGVALASSVTSSILVVFLARRFASAEEGFASWPLVRTTLLALMAALPATALAALVGWLGVGRGVGIPDVVLLLLIGAFGLLAYAVIARLIGLREPGIVLGLVADRLSRRRSPA